MSKEHKKSKTIEERFSKREVALAYSPHLTPHGAMKRLSRWIKRCKPLYNALKKTGYNDLQRKFSNKQKNLIYRYLGPP